MVHQRRALLYRRLLNCYANHKPLLYMVQAPLYPYFKPSSSATSTESITRLAVMIVESTTVGWSILDSTIEEKIFNLRPGNRQRTQNPSCTPLLPRNVIALMAISRLSPAFRELKYLLIGPGSGAKSFGCCLRSPGGSFLFGMNSKIYAVERWEVILRRQMNLAWRDREVKRAGA